MLTPVDDPSAFGVVPTDEDGRVKGFIEKPPPDEAPTNLINAGVYMLEPSVLQRIPAGVEWSAERALFPGLVEEGARLFATSTDAYWMDVGTPEKYLHANLDALAGRFRTEAVRIPAPTRTRLPRGPRLRPAPGYPLPAWHRTSWSRKARRSSAPCCYRGRSFRAVPRSWIRSSEPT